VLLFQLLIAVLGGWLHREQADVIAFLREENRLLKARLAGRRLRFDDASVDDSLSWGLSRSLLLVQVATLVTPDTILRLPPRAGRAQVRPIARAKAVLRTRRHASERSSFGWRPRTPRGVTRAFRVR
jgi:hypothetical protein